MRLIANDVNQTYLEEILDQSTKYVSEIEKVKVAVAYADGDPKLISYCKKYQLHLEFWGRSDHTVPISSNVLNSLLSYSLCKLKVVTDFYHPKVIWWVGYGAYIGSANLSERGWKKNIECGIFLTEEDLDREGLHLELENFFHIIDANSSLVTQDYVAKIQELEKSFQHSDSDSYNQDAKQKSMYQESILPLIPNRFNGISVVGIKKNAIDRNRDDFVFEWNQTLDLLRKIGRMVSEDNKIHHNISKSTPAGLITEAFLHAYYYTFVMTKNKSNYLEFFEHNKANPEKALADALKWWFELERVPKEEEMKLNVDAPRILDLLSPSNILVIKKEDFKWIAKRIHSMRTIARQISKEDLNVDEENSIVIDQRTELFVDWLWVQQSKEGKTLIELLYFMLYGGEKEHLVLRIYECAFSPKWHIPRIGLSTLGELVGYVMSANYPPRNGRTSKTLKALGFPVKVHVGG